MLFVDDDQTEGPKRYIFREQGVGPDDDIDLAVFEIILDLAGPALGHQPRQLLNPDRQTGEAFAEILVMLQGEQRRRGDNRHLQAVERRHEGRL